MLLLDPELNVLEANPAAERLLDRPRAALLERDVRHVLPPELRNALEPAWERLVQGQPTGMDAASNGVLLAPVHHRGRLEVVVATFPRPAAEAPSAPIARDALAPKGSEPPGVTELRHAIDVGQLRLHYQPIVELTGAPVASEALVRWQHPHRGLIAPEEFVGLAERTGLVVSLGEWVLREVCRVVATWDDTLPLTVTVNLSAGQLLDRSLLGALRRALEETGCPPRRLVFEVTETAVMADLPAAVSTLTALKDIGVGLAIDDFGTGYSSLLYLKHFPVDSIKIDRAFVAGLGRDADDSAIVAATISLAHAVNVRCVAEGVETVEHLDLLRRMDCDYAQGFLFSRPLELDALQRWFEAHLPRHSEGSAPKPAQPQVVSPVLELLERGASLHTIAAALNSSGSRTEKGTRWNARSVARVVAQGTFPDVQLPPG